VELARGDIILIFFHPGKKGKKKEEGKKRGKVPFILLRILLPVEKRTKSLAVFKKGKVVLGWGGGGGGGFLGGGCLLGGGGGGGGGF